MSSSDTDDTDILILIPPNFFSTKAESDVELKQRNSGSESLKSHVVKGIINHINELEDRVSTIETLDSSRTSYYSDSEMNNRYSNGYNKSPTSGGSLARTPIRSKPMSTCHSTPSTVPARRLHSRDNLSKSFSPQTNGNKNESSKHCQEKLLNEIDDFYSIHSNKVPSKHNDSDNLGTSIDMDISNTIEGTLSNLSTSPPHNSSKETLDLPAIERILKQVDATQKEFEEKLKQKEEDFNLNPKRAFSCGSNVQSVPELNFGLRNVLYDNSQQKDDLADHMSKKQVTPLQESCEPRAKRKLNLGEDTNLMYQNEMTAGIRELCKANFPSEELVHQANSIPAKLLSLSELWKQDKCGESPSSKSSNSSAILRRKIEEEKYRREHCEQLIQQLQFRLLEEQEKVAVALRVDSEKDRAIRVLQAGWTKLVAHWREIEAQRHELTNRLIQEKQERQSEVEELSKKLERYEREVSQVVNLAAGYKEKAEKAEADKQTVQYEAQTALDSMREGLEEMQTSMADSRHKLEDYQRDRKLLADKLTLTEEELDKEKLLTKEVKNQLEELKVTLRISKDKIETLERNLDTEIRRSRKLEEELQDVRHTCEEVVKKEQKAQEEIATLLSKSSSIKSELRDFYQNQLNNNVKEKLKEFQSQLDAAELTLHREFQQRERSIVENAAKQLKQISDKLISDFKSKCEVYETENKRLKAELTARESKLKESHQMLREESKKRELMAKKVEAVMQNQLQQAIHMITSDVGHLQLSKESLANKTHQSEPSLVDSTTENHNPSQVYTKNQQSAPNINQHPTSDINQQPTSNVNQQPIYSMNQQPTSNINQHYMGFNMNQQPTSLSRPYLGSNMNQHCNMFSADSTLHAVEKDVPDSGDEMRKYIEMLLEKPPGNPVSEFETDAKGSVALATGTSFLESSVTSDIFNEVSYPNISKTSRSKSNDHAGSQAKVNSKKIWK